MPTKGYRTEAERRLTMGDALGLTKLPKLREAKPHGQTRALKNFAPGGLCAPRGSGEGSVKGAPDNWPTERNVMSFGEQFVELLGEFVDAREQYAHSRRGVGGEYANSDDVNKAADALQKLLDRRFP